MEAKELEFVAEILEKRGKHSIFCKWNRDTGRYEIHQPCTCGLDEALEMMEARHEAE